MHRTHYNLKNDVKNLIINNKYPVHFWVNGDGKIYQQTSLNNQSYHIGVAQKSHTKSNKWGNNNSISIEVNGEYFDKNGKRANQEVVGGYWEKPTEHQSKSVACLVCFLMKHYNLPIEKVQVHEDLCVKTKGEGRTVYDAMLPYLKLKK
ncbi:N-acetyl-anhydromuramyl-L-alanine amidase AmpD [Moheibacter stercoris]|uniref:N-acetylmuramoyl-L-alanine amidase n=1 Tax=Moheibacter stercoris TaxID=1628251 RepID=A0ABV2LPH1_9FLAO